ncbi:LacI family DNA-binding transcriptional regulator [Mycoplasma marinum]|nr:LacI family DNA-binding transcriptional regulator [Mycoplasma marinum]
MNEKINFKELAALSNVSIGTLSRFFNGGAVSKKNKLIISKNIEKYNFVKKSAAARVRGKNNQLIILRTLIKSTTLDNIVSGIIENVSSNVIVKYSGQNEEQVIKGIEEAISEEPKNLVIFAPINPTEKFEKILNKASKYSKVVVYNYENPYASNVSVSYEAAFKDISKKYNKINFVYDNKEDIPSFSRRIEQLKKANISLTVSKNIATKNINFYQSNSLYTRISHTKKSNSIVISYSQPIEYTKKTEWVFVDQYYVGLCIARLCKLENNENIIVKAKYIK